MTTTRRYAVLILTTDIGTGLTGAAALEMLDRSAAGQPAELRRSVADYWSDVTGGEIRLTWQHLQPVVLPATDPDWAALAADVGGRGAHLATLVERHVSLATRLATDGVLVLSSLPTARAFASDFEVEVRPGRTVRKPAGYTAINRPHRTCAHEVGHMLGFGHAWGEVDSALDKHEYASSYCVMGGTQMPGTDAAERSLRLGPPPGTAVPVEAAWWTELGPGLTRASWLSWTRRQGRPDPVWLGTQGLPPAGRDTLLEVGDDTAAEGISRAVLVGPPDLGGFVVEVRRPRPTLPLDWDGALRFDRPDEPAGVTGVDDDTVLSDAPGVVVHRFGTVLGDDGELEQGVPVYVGTIPVPAAGRRDVVVAGLTGHHRLTLVSYAGGVARLSLAAGLRQRPSLLLTTSARATPSFLELAPRVSFEVAGVGPGCGVGRYFARSTTQQVELQVRASAAGSVRADAMQSGTPRFGWTVAGTDVGEAPIGTQQPRTLVVDLDVEVPSGDREWTRERQRVELAVTVAWDRLRVVCPPGHGRYRLPVEARLLPAEPGTSAVLATTSHSFQVETAALRFEARLAQDTAECHAWLRAQLDDLAERFPGSEVGVLLEKTDRRPVRRWTPEEVAGAVSAIGRVERLPDLGRRRRIDPVG